MSDSSRKRLKQYQKDVLLTQHQIVHAINEKKYSKALEHMATLFRLAPYYKSDLKSDYLKTLELACKILEEEEQWEALFGFYQSSLEIFPDSVELNYQLGNYLKRLNFKSKAILYFLKAMTLDKHFTRARIEFEDLKNELVERWHFGMLNDTRRNETFEKAIVQAVQKNCGLILDIGAGTGILSMCAVRAGARQVYACELSTPMAEIATEVLRLNNMEDRVHLINQASTDLQVPRDLPTRASLVVTETFDAALLGENILQTLSHAWQHLLLPPPPSGMEDCSMLEFGHVLPRKASVYISLVECPRLRQKFWYQGSEVCGHQLTKVQLVQKEAAEDPYTTEKLSTVPEGYCFLATPDKPIFTVDFNNPLEVMGKAAGFEAVQQLSCSTSGHCDAVVLWFELDLGAGLSLSTRPPDSGCWDQAVFPVLPSLLRSSDVRVEEGEEIKVTLSYSDHLRLKSLERSHATDSRSSPQQVLVPGDGILRLNLADQSDFTVQELRKQPWSRHLTVLDISTQPWMGLWALGLGAKQVYLTSPEWREVLSQVVGPKLASRLGEWTEEKVDLLLVDPREGTLLSPNYFGPMDSLREKCLKPGSGKVIPSEVQLSAVLIQSLELLESARVLSKDRTLGFEIGDIINMYQTVVHQDLSLTQDMDVSQPLTLAMLKPGTSAVSSQIPFLCTNSVWAIAVWLGPPTWPRGPVACHILQPHATIRLSWTLDHDFLHFSFS